MNETVEQPTCDEVLQACDKYATELEKSNNNLRDLIKVQNEIIDEASDSYSRVPWYVWLLVGGAGGILAMEFAR